MGGGLRNAGVSRYTRNLTKALLAIDNNSYVIFSNSSVRDNPYKYAKNAEFVRTSLPTSRTSARVLWEQFSLPLHSALRQLDIVHSFLNVVPLLSTAAQVVTIHDLSYLTTPWAHPLQRKLFLRVMSKRSAHIAGAVLADSKATKADIANIFRVPDEKIWVVYPGLEPDMRPATSRSEIEQFRARKGLPERFILYLGTLEPRKNVDNLIRAFGRIRRSGIYDGELVIAGARGWGFQTIESTIETESLGSSVHLVGYVDRAEQPLWYDAAQVFAYPSAYEGFGMPVLEAMACGTPVVTSCVSSLPELVGDAGLTVDPNSVDGIADALARLVNSASLRDEYRERGIARASHFSWEIAAARCLKAYDYALRNG